MNILISQSNNWGELFTSYFFWIIIACIPTAIYVYFKKDDRGEGFGLLGYLIFKVLKNDRNKS